MYKIKNKNHNNNKKRNDKEIYIYREKGTNNIGEGMTTSINNETIAIKNSY